MSTEDEVRELVSMATLGEGILREADEHRIVKVLLTAGFSALEAREKVDASLAALGARRASAPASPAPPGDAPGEDGAAAPPEAVERAITRSFKKPTRRTLERPASEEEPIVAELVTPADETTQWSGVCTACLEVVSYEDVRSGRAEVHQDGSRHCRSCLSKLRAGLLCKNCYKPISRDDLSSGAAQLHGHRAVHAACVKPSRKKTK